MAADDSASSVTSDRELVDPRDCPTAIADTDGPQIIVAGPGAGKSEFLVRRAAHLLDDRGLPGAALLTLTFSRRAAADLADRVRTAVQAPAPAAASTFHAFSYRLLEQHAPRVLGWTEMPAILTGPEQVSLVAELLRSSRPHDWPLPFRDLLGTRTLASEVTDFILRARERLVDGAELSRLAGARADWRALPSFMVEYDAALRSANRIDYGTLQIRAVEALGDPRVRGETAEQYRYLLVDEYQRIRAHLVELIGRMSE